MHFLPIFLIAISANIDSFAVAIAFSVKKIRIGILSNLVISTVSGLGTFLSTSAGRAISNDLPTAASNFFGSGVLAGVGFWVIWEALEMRKKDRNRFSNREPKHSLASREVVKAPEQSAFEHLYNKFSYKGILEKPETVDKDRSGYIDVKESIALALSLTLNNLSIGIGAGIAGFNVAATSLLSFILSALALVGGYLLGKHFPAKISVSWAGIVSGCLLIGLGIYEYLFF